jgi:hypothetical protein
VKLFSHRSEAIDVSSGTLFDGSWKNMNWIAAQIWIQWLKMEHKTPNDIPFKAEQRRIDIIQAEQNLVRQNLYFQEIQFSLCLPLIYPLR